MVKRCLIALLALTVCGVAAASAVAAAPHWRITSLSRPTDFAPGDSDGRDTYVLIATNTGDAPAEGSSTPLVVSDTLPSGLTLDSKGPSGTYSSDLPGSGQVEMTCTATPLTCAYSGSVAPGGQLIVTVPVDVAASLSGGVINTATVMGGDASASTSESTSITSAAPLYGFQRLETFFLDSSGAPDTQAGSHPYSMTVNFDLNSVYNPVHLTEPVRSVKDAFVALPQGLLGNPVATPRCAERDFINDGNEPACPADSQVGGVEIELTGGLRFVFPVYNLVPPAGVPAEFGFDEAGVNVYFNAGVRTGGDYGITIHVANIGQREVLGTSVTLWGVPNDPSHDSQRTCTNPSGNGGPCVDVTEGTPRPFLGLPTSCTGPLSTSMQVDSWEEPASFVSDSAFTLDESGDPVGLGGCERLDFSPSISVQPDTSTASSPSGLNVDLHLPQNEEPNGLAEGNLKDAVVTLPAGVSVSPSAADGLGACTPQQIGIDNASPVACPDASKVGSVEVDTPILPQPLEGSVFLAQQGENPFGSLLALYVVAEGSGVLLKIPAEVRLDPVTGQITTVFENAPQQPFSDFKLSFFGGPRAALSTPAGCGTYTADTLMTPYNSETPVEGSSSFQIGEGCAGGQFAPSFVAGTTNNQAGGFGPLSVTFSRSDQDQDFGSVKVSTPPGLLGLLKTVPLCGEPQAAAGTCGEASLIGHTTISAGPGSDPYTVSGKVFLTGPYKGAPFGLSVVVPAVAGPFNLGTVVVRAAISVDPHTAALTVTSDPLPTILQGIPLQLRTVNVTIDRPGFVFNPTDCEPLSVGATITSTQGTQAQVSSHFQAADCASLPFKPVFTVSTQAATSKHNGASLTVKGRFPAGEANVHSVAVTLPKQLPARLTTIQQACPEATFAANPATCPAGSMIGTATATTPILANPVVGPTYLVSHGGAAFPNIVAVLQGEGVTVDLTGSIDIKKDVTSSDFATVPDVPIGTFEVNLPEGPHSGLAAVLPAKAKGSMCDTSLTMPFTITGQNGAVVKENNKIAITGCPRPKQAKAKRKVKKKRK
jgi:uncharacterized repeat protein (TIGR01451 family)